jgi:hypothetical protein
MEALVEALLHTIRRLCDIAVEAGKRPNAYIAYEHRDDAQYASFLAKAEALGFKVRSVPAAKIRKAVRTAYGWTPDMYTGITVMHMKP